ncbi:MAG: hypothetical protein ACREMH_11265 [Gemmatimonadales bacterium]
MRSPVFPAVVLAVTLASNAAAQSSPVTRDDSLSLGRKYVRWVYENQVDSLWNRLDEQMKSMMGSKDVMIKETDELVIAFGTEVQVVEETVTARDGNLVYTREAKFDGRPDEAMVWSWTIAPDGAIKGARIQPKSPAQQQPAPAPPPPPAKPDSAAKPGS